MKLFHQCTRCLRFWYLDPEMFAGALCPACMQGTLLYQWPDAVKTWIELDMPAKPWFRSNSFIIGRQTA